MNALRLLPVCLSCWLLAAHFVRAGYAWPAGLFAAIPALLLLRERWIPPLFQVLLGLGALEWLRTLVVLASARGALGEPWMRLALIVGSVALLTAASALVFRSAELRRRFRDRP
jgi:hypothetical protein